jgi:hypothetical protein
MSAKTQKNWRELRDDLHNEQYSDQLKDVHELNGAREGRVIEITTLSEVQEPAHPDSTQFTN